MDVPHLQNTIPISNRWCFAGKKAKSIAMKSAPCNERRIVTQCIDFLTFSFSKSYCLVEPNLGLGIRHGSGRC